MLKKKTKAPKKRTSIAKKKTARKPAKRRS